ncbi:LOW QUALITY PROTEIN: 3-oxoacyl-[acyl-carrier-protein] reductase FabG-like [Aphomia sociella]
MGEHGQRCEPLRNLKHWHANQTSRRTRQAQGGRCVPAGDSMESRSRSIGNGYKLVYTGASSGKNGVAAVLSEGLQSDVLEYYNLFGEKPCTKFVCVGALIYFWCQVAVLTLLCSGFKEILITGASSGIGADAATQFVKEGADVAIVGRNETKLKNVVEQCKKFGKTPLVIKAVVSSDEDAKRIIKETVDRFGKLGVLVNNAGFTNYERFLMEQLFHQESYDDAYDTIIHTNVRAVIQLTTLAATHLVKTNGNIINISSVAGFAMEIVPQMAYCLSKATVNHFTKGLELASSGVRVNAVSPGPVITNFLNNAAIHEISWDKFRKELPLKRVSEPEEISHMISFLASEEV